jgi:hypothetical protein
MAAAAPAAAVEEPKKCYQQNGTKRYGVITGHVVRPAGAKSSLDSNQLPPHLKDIFAAIGGGGGLNYNTQNMVHFMYRSDIGNNDIKVDEVPKDSLEEVPLAHCTERKLVGGYRRRRRTHRKRHTRRRSTRARKH